jgi:hypothetical protein
MSEIDLNYYMVMKERAFFVQTLARVHLGLLDALVVNSIETKLQFEFRA